MLIKQLDPSCRPATAMGAGLGADDNGTPLWQADAVSTHDRWRRYASTESDRCRRYVSWTHDRWDAYPFL